MGSGPPTGRAQTPMTATPPHTTASIARAITLAGLEVELRGPGDVAITRFDPADQAAPGGITFYRGDSFAKAWHEGGPSAALVARASAEAYSTNGKGAQAGRALLVVADVDLASIAVLKLFAPPAPPRRPGVHSSSIVDPSASVSPDAAVGPLCVIGPGARVAAGVTLHAGVLVGAGASVGTGTTLYPGVKVLDRCAVGERCILHAGVVIGADGFGFRATPSGLAKIPHIGNVVIEDEVEIGANSCIDRGKIGSTIIGRGTKIDNLVQVAHNCKVGKCCILCGHVGLAGSVTLGDGVVLGGGVGVADGVSIGGGSRVAAQSGVMNDIPPGEDWLGAPAGNAKEMRRNYAVFRHLAQTLAEFKKALKRENGE